MKKEEPQKDYSPAWKFQDEYACSEKGKLIMPKGIFRFKTHEEANEWWEKNVKHKSDVKKK